MRSDALANERLSYNLLREVSYCSHRIEKKDKVVLSSVKVESSNQYKQPIHTVNSSHNSECFFLIVVNQKTELVECPNRKESGL